MKPTELARLRPQANKMDELEPRKMAVIEAVGMIAHKKIALRASLSMNEAAWRRWLHRKWLDMTVRQTAESKRNVIQMKACKRSAKNSRLRSAFAVIT